MGPALMNKGRCFYRRIKVRHLENDGVTIRGQAFMPSENDIKKKSGPSVMPADMVKPSDAMMAPIKGQIKDWCEAKGGHLAEFRDTALPSGFSIKQKGKKKSHYEIEGPIYEDEKATYEWAYKIAAKARLRLRCVGSIAKDVLPGIPPCGSCP
jgi:hypothetical protein